MNATRIAALNHVTETQINLTFACNQVARARTFVKRDQEHLAHRISQLETAILQGQSDLNAIIHNFFGLVFERNKKFLQRRIRLLSFERNDLALQLLHLFYVLNFWEGQVELCRSNLRRAAERAFRTGSIPCPICGRHGQEWEGARKQSRN
jgi:hypothetical protein